MKVLSIDENKGFNGDDEEEEEEEEDAEVVAAVDIRFINARDDIVYCM